jgi:hypothetical protein
MNSMIRSSITPAFFNQKAPRNPFGQDKGPKRVDFDSYDEAPIAAQQLQSLVNERVVPAVNAMGYPLSPISDEMRDGMEEAGGLLMGAKGVGDFIKKPSQYGRGLKSLGETVEASDQSDAFMAGYQQHDMNPFLDKFTNRPEINKDAIPVGLSQDRRQYQPTAQEASALRGLLDKPKTDNPMYNRLGGQR